MLAQWNFLINPMYWVFAFVSFIFAAIFIYICDSASARQWSPAWHTVCRVLRIIVFIVLLLALTFTLLAYWVGDEPGLGQSRTARDYVLLVAGLGVLIYAHLKENYRALIYGSIAGAAVAALAGAAAVAALAGAEYFVGWRGFGFAIPFALMAWPIFFVGAAVWYAIFQVARTHLKKARSTPEQRA